VASERALPPPAVNTRTAAFRGIWPALLTPLRPDLSIDRDRWVTHARGLLDAGCGGVTPFGTTGEGTGFSVDERIAAVEALVAGGVPGQRIIVSTSCAALPDVVALMRHALAVGAHGCLMLPPFFIKGVGDDGILDCYRWVFDHVADARLRVYLYHIPQVSAVALSHHVIATLKREYPHIVLGIKDSQCDRDHSVALAQAFAGELDVYVGNELDLPTLGRLGSAGAISGLANFWPRRVHRLVSTPDAPATEHDLAQVDTLLKTLAPHALIPALKAMMAWRSGDDAWLRVRPPLRALDAGTAERLRGELQALAVDPCQD